MGTNKPEDSLAQAQQLITSPPKPGSDWFIRELIVERGCMAGRDETELTIRMSARNGRAATALVQRLVQLMKEQT